MSEADLLPLLLFESWSGRFVRAVLPALVRRWKGVGASVRVAQWVDVYVHRLDLALVGASLTRRRLHLVHALPASVDTLLEGHVVGLGILLLRRRPVNALLVSIGPSELLFLFFRLEMQLLLEGETLVVGPDVLDHHLDEHFHHFLE